MNDDEIPLREARLKVRNQLGLHARAAAKLALLARSFQSTIRIRHGNRWANATSILDVMVLGVGPGTEIAAVATGPDAAAALPALEQLFERAFDEQETDTGIGCGHALELCTDN